MVALALLSVSPACVVDEGEGAPEVLAELSVPTEDGLAEYRFELSRLADGPLVTRIESPLGYPEVVVNGECALDTFLRVAPADMVVPEALLAECGVPGADGGRRALAATDPVFTAGELRRGDLALATEPPRRRCSRSEFDHRLDELRALASFQPSVPDCELECLVWAEWDESSCVFVYPDGSWDECSALDHQFLLTNYGPSGQGCAEQDLVCGPPIPAPACDHTEWVIGDWGPYGVWQRESAGSKTSKVIAELSNCGGETGRGWWQAKEDSGPWSSQQVVPLAPNALTTIVLSAGVMNGDWRGWDFRLHADGSKLHAATAWVELQGRNAATCPILF